MLDQRVALDMAQRVVDGLEVVEVEEQDPDGLGVVAPLSQRLLEPVDEEGPVRQPGQRVVEGLPGELGLE